MSDRWRYSCPFGHRHISTRRNPESARGLVGRTASFKWYCDTCKQGYPKIWDLKRKTWVTRK